jgi:hypothetical protein
MRPLARGGGHPSSARPGALSNQLRLADLNRLGADKGRAGEEHSAERPARPPFPQRSARPSLDSIRASSGPCQVGARSARMACAGETSPGGIDHERMLVSVLAARQRVAAALGPGAVRRLERPRCGVSSLPRE